MNLLATRPGRRLLFGALYLSEGAPIGFIWWALPAKLRSAGVGLDTITQLTALLVLPWVFKFVWSPLIDTLRTPRWTLRSWILSMQALMGCTLLPLLILDLQTHLHVVFLFLLVHAFAAATQDTAIDALAISTVPAYERGSINGWMQVGMLTGRSALGGGALMLERLVGPDVVVLLLIAVVWSSSLLLVLSPRAEAISQDGKNIADRVRIVLPRLRALARSRVTWLALLFAATAGAGFEAVGAVAGPFLIDKGLSLEAVGQFFALNSVLGMASGAVAGGYLTDRWGTRKTVAAFLLIMFLCILVLAGVESTNAPGDTISAQAALTALYFCIGLFTAATYTLFMQITDPELGATQFSAFMGATNGCESWATFAVGKAVPAMGYALAFTLMGFVSILALPLVRIVTTSRRETAR